LPRQKKIPLRTCISCRGVMPKRDLVRIVRTPEGNIIVDPTGKANGRGAYICPTEKCLNAAIKSKRLAEALGVSISPEDLEKLKEQLETYIKASGS